MYTEEQKQIIEDMLTKVCKEQNKDLKGLVFYEDDSITYITRDRLPKYKIGDLVKLSNGKRGYITLVDDGPRLPYKIAYSHHSGGTTAEWFKEDDIIEEIL